MQKMSPVHKKIGELIYDIYLLSDNMCKLIAINPKAAFDGLTMIETNVKILNTLFKGLVEKE